MANGARDFDFLIGRWRIQNRRLRERLKGSTEWDAFEATHVFRPLLHGLGNEDEFHTDYWPDFIGMAFRFFNPETQLWAIYWADSRRGVLEPPVFGRFEGDTGVFEGTDTFEGRPIRVRFIWSRVTMGAPRWEQAFSDDDGRTWETNWVMDFTRECREVLELRQYTMQPGRRDTLIEIFERHFLKEQEDLGMTVQGQFRDRRRDDRFVFVRSFPDLPSRQTSLERSYSGAVWAEQRDAANATMIDWHDVLLLRPARADTTFRLDVRDRPAPGEARAASLVLAGIHGLRRPADEAAIAVFEQRALPILRARGVRVEGLFVTESARNNYPRLPIREGEHVLVWIGTLEPRASDDKDEERDAGDKPDARDGRDTRYERDGRDERVDRLTAALGTVPELTALARDREPLVVLELEPTPRSLLGRPPATR